LFVVNGGLHWLVPMEDLLLRNNGNGTFTDVSEDAGPYFKEKKVGRGAAFADYDNDGWMDAFIVVLGGKGILLHANPPAANVRNHWLTLKLTGTKSNRDAFGARIEAVAGDLHQTVENCPQSGYLSQNDPRPHFGLGSHAEVDVLTIRWPGGTVQTLQHVKADQILRVTEPREGESAFSKGGKQ
jgi:enediyne biosynthesis protein E4